MAAEARRTTSRKLGWPTAVGMRSASVKKIRLRKLPERNGWQRRQRSGSRLTKLTFVTNKECRARVIKRRQKLLRQLRKPQITKTIEIFGIGYERAIKRDVRQKRQHQMNFAKQKT